MEGTVFSLYKVKQKLTMYCTLVLEGEAQAGSLPSSDTVKQTGLLLSLYRPYLLPFTLSIFYNNSRTYTVLCPDLS